MTTRPVPEEPLPPEPVHDAGRPDGEPRILDGDSRLRQVVLDYRDRSIGDEAQLSRVKSRVMEILAQELARGPSAALTTALGRDYAMTLSALRALVREAVDEEPGVYARRVHLGSIDAAEMTLDLRVTMTLSASTVIPDLQDRLRTSIAKRLRDAVGLRTGTIDLIAEDIYDD